MHSFTPFLIQTAKYLSSLLKLMVEIYLSNIVLISYVPPVLTFSLVVTKDGKIGLAPFVALMVNCLHLLKIPLSI